MTFFALETAAAPLPTTWSPGEGGGVATCEQDELAALRERVAALTARVSELQAEPEELDAGGRPRWRTHLARVVARHGVECRRLLGVSGATARRWIGGEEAPDPEARRRLAELAGEA